jgi:hypothetical protein
MSDGAPWLATEILIAVKLTQIVQFCEPRALFIVLHSSSLLLLSHAKALLVFKRLHLRHQQYY